MQDALHASGGLSIQARARFLVPDRFMPQAFAQSSPFMVGHNMFKFLGVLHPVIYMMMAVGTYSVIPVLFKLGGAEESPFLFTGILQICTGVGVGAVILLFKKELPIKSDRSDVVKDIAMSPYKAGLVLFSIIGSCDIALFALGFALVGVSVATILFETWPFFLMLLLSYLFFDKRKARNKQRYGTISSTLIIGMLAIAGVALVVLSHNDTPHPLLSIGVNFTQPGALLGAFLALAGSFCVAVRAATTLKLGEALAEKHSPSSEDKRKTGEIVFAIAAACISNVVAGVVCCAIGLVASEPISSQQMVYAAATGFIVNSIGMGALRAANLKTANLGVNALAYATPLIALIWLWSLSILDVSHLDYLIIGAMGIVASNLLINAKADMRVAYSALVMSLWVFGTFVYFHDGYTTDVPLELPVTVFILVLSFRVDRLVRRTSQEEDWLFEAFRRFELLVAKRHIRDDAWREPMLKIDRHENLHELTAAYGKLTTYLAAQMKRGKAPGGTMDEIMGIRHLVDNLAHSRQQGAHFGEIVAIALTGALIVTGLLFFSGEREIYKEIASFVLSAVLVFLFFNILDLQKDRRGRILQHGGKEYDGEYMVKFDDKARSRKVQQWISVVTSAVIVLVFAWLFTWERVPF